MMEPQNDTTDFFRDDFTSGEYSIKGESCGIMVAAPKRTIPPPRQIRIIDLPGIDFSFSGGGGTPFPVQTLKFDHSLYFRESGTINFDMKQKGAKHFSRVTIGVYIDNGREVSVEDLPRFFTCRELLRAVWLSIMQKEHP